MRKSNGCLFMLSALFFIQFLAGSCKKSVDASNSSTNSLTGDSSSRPSETKLTQNIYTIDSTASPAAGIILASPYNVSISPALINQGLVLIMDQSGNVLKEKTTPGATFNFNRWILNGQTRYTYLVNDPGAYRTGGVLLNAGYAIITDSNLNEIQRVNFVPYGENLFPSGQSLDVHEFVPLADSDYLTLSYYVKHVSNIPAYLNPSSKVSVVTPVIEELDHGAVVWTWEGSTDTAFYANSVEGNKFSDSVTAQDYIHLNSIIVDPGDGNLICSMRNQDQVIKINRQTGAVIWRLGGKNSDFPMTSNQVFLRQHDATLADNNQTLLLFDDGEAKQRPSSRVVEFKLDEAAKQVNSFSSFDIPEPFSQVMGSVQKIGNEYFIGGGSADYMLEVNYVTGQKVIEFKGTEATYRAFKL
jgi:hypothetical protein